MLSAVTGIILNYDFTDVPRWTETIAVGSEGKTKAQLGIRAIGREVSEEDRADELREDEIPYNAILAGENSGLKPKNTRFWDRSG